jgi:hypothetical protein
MMETEFLDDAINRSVLVVRPAEPFKRWAAKMGGETLAQMNDSLADDHTAYLIPVQDSLELDPKLLKAIYATIFERELFSCYTDQSQWPKPRTLALFRQWFDLELCGLVVDLCEGGIKREI